MMHKKFIHSVPSSKVLQLFRQPLSPPSALSPHLEFALCEPCAEVGDALGCDLAALRLVLGHLVLQGDEANGGALLFLQAEELQDALVVVNVAVDEDEQDLEVEEETVWNVNVNMLRQSKCLRRLETNVDRVGFLVADVD